MALASPARLTRAASSDCDRSLMERKCLGLVIVGPEAGVVGRGVGAMVVLRERVILRRVLGRVVVVRRRRESARMEVMVRVLRLCICIMMSA